MVKKGFGGKWPQETEAETQYLINESNKKFKGQLCTSTAVWTEHAGVSN